jgi:ABC-type transporter Mla MlaB component
MSAPFELPAELNIYTAAETTQALLRWLQFAQSQQINLLQIDGRSVAEVDAAGLQILLSLHNTCSNHALAWQLHQPSQTLAAACTRLGIPTGTPA